VGGFSAIIVIISLFLGFLGDNLATNLDFFVIKHNVKPSINIIVAIVLANGGQRLYYAESLCIVCSIKAQH